MGYLQKNNPTVETYIHYKIVCKFFTWKEIPQFFSLGKHQSATIMEPGQTGNTNDCSHPNCTTGHVGRSGREL